MYAYVPTCAHLHMFTTQNNFRRDWLSHQVDETGGENVSAPQKVTSVHPIQPHHSSVQPYELFISKTFPSTSQRTEPQPTLLVLEFAAPISVQSISQKSCGRSILCPGIALACLHYMSKFSNTWEYNSISHLHGTLLWKRAGYLWSSD